MLRRTFGDATRGVRRERECRSTVDHEADAECRFGAECHDQDEAGDHRAGDAAQCIEGVGRSHVGRPGGIPPGGEVREQRETETHPQRRDEHDGTDRHAHEE